LLQSLANFFFLPHLPSNRRALAWGWIALIYFAGIYWYGLFFDWGRDMPLYQDWADVNVPRLTFLRSALQNGEFPLHISDSSVMHGAIVRYLTIPDTFISPQLLLLARFSVLRFNFINVVLLYTAGMAGLLALRARLRLSLFAFTSAALLFFFNGNILAHYGVGHLTWGGYFLFPWFIALMLRFLAGERSWRWTFWLALLLFSIWLQGSFHQYVWLLLFLGICALTIRGAFWPLLRAICCALLLSAFRILPSLLLQGNYNAQFNNGFPGLSSVFAALVFPGNQAALYPVPLTFHTAGGWEFSASIGLGAALAVLYFGVYRGLLAPSSPYRPFALPLAGLLLLSLNEVFALIRLAPVPLVQGERVVTRILSLVLAFLIIFAAERFQRWRDGFSLASANSRVAVGGLFFFLITAGEAWLNIRAWRVATLRNLFLPVNFYASKWYVANNYGDTLYLWLVFGGLAVSILIFFALAYLAFRPSRSSFRGGHQAL
jgi:hypothetical protein